MYIYMDEHICTFIAHSIIPRIRNDSDKRCREKQNTFYAQ